MRVISQALPRSIYRVRNKYSMSGQFANIGGTRTTGKAKDSLRNIFFNQTVPNPLTTNGGNPYGNTVRITYPYPQTFNDSEVALVSLYMWFSWYNIQSSFGNNTFQYSFPTTGGNMTFNVTIQDGYYSFDTLNQFLEQAMIANGTYLLDASGNPVYYLSFAPNSASYRVTVFANPVPASLPTDYSLPSNFPGGGLPGSPKDPSLIIMATQAPAGSNSPGQYSFSKTMGWLPGTYPALNTSASYIGNGTYPPVIESTNNINVACSLVNQGGLNQYTNVFYTFAPTVSFGSQIVIEPPIPLFVPVTDGQYSAITITFYDENLVPLNIQDPHISGTIIVRGH